MRCGRIHGRLRCAVRLVAGLGWIGVAGLAAAQAGLWDDHGGLGLRPSNTGPAISPATAESAPGAPSFTPSHRDYWLYSGVRDVPRFGASSAESYSGLAYSLSPNWESTVEAGVVPESVGSPRRYSLAGQLGTALAGGRGVSVGLKYRQYDTGSDVGAGPYAVLLGRAGQAISPLAASGFESSYEVRLRYHYSASSSFGLALGRDLETLTPGLDAPANGERQLMFTGQHWLTPRWGLTYDLLSDEPGGSMRVQGLRLGVRYRF